MRRLRALFLIALLAPPVSMAQPLMETTLETSTPQYSLYTEDFEGDVHTLQERGWTTATLIGPRPPYALIRNASTLLGAEGARGSATTADVSGAYPARLDARLVSPPYNLQHIAGAPVPDDPPSPRPLAEATSLAWDLTADARRNLSNDENKLVAFDTRPVFADTQEAILWPPGGPIVDDRVNLTNRSPLPNFSRMHAPSANVSHPTRPDAVGDARLVIRQSWSFSPGDGVSLEARERATDGTWSAWFPLAPAVAATDTIEIPHVLPPGGLVGYNGALGDGTGAFIGASGRLVTTEVALGRFAGKIIQIAFHVRTDSPLPPDAFGHVVDNVEVRATLADVDIAVEGFGPLSEGAMVALGTWITPEIQIRNWGALPATNVSVNASLRLDGAHVPGSPHLTTIDLAPGEVRTIPLRAMRLMSPGDLTLAAQVGREIARLDLRPQNDRATIHFKAADEARVALTLTVPPVAVVTGVREEKRILVDITNAGTAPAIGAILLRATNTSGAQTTIASVDVSIPPIGPIVSGALPEVDPTPFELTWTPAERGTYVLRAELGTARSSDARVYVDLSPPPILETAFPSSEAASASFGSDDADGLANWSFESWSLSGDDVLHDAPAAPSPRRMLVARTVDDAGAAELRDLQDTERSLARATNVTLILPTRANLSNDQVISQNLSTNLSYARLLFAAESVGCACEDIRDRIPILAPLLNTTVHQENLSLDKDRTSFDIDNTTLKIGGQNASLLYVIVDSRLDPGATAQYSPLAIEREGGDTAVLLPASQPMSYEDDGLRCCVFGPLSSSELLAALSATPNLPRLGSTQFMTQHTIARPLDDLLALVPPGGEAALLLEHRATFRWTNSTGTRGIVELDHTVTPPELRAPLADAITIENQTAGWQALWIPLTAADLTEPPQLRLTLQTSPSDEPLGTCAYLDSRARCEVSPSWYIDELRIMHRVTSTTPWRVVARDDIEREHVAPRWTSTSGTGVPSTSARGWSLQETTKEAPHRFALTTEGVQRDGEESPTRALAWGSARGTPGAIWSLARSPALDLADLTAPTLSFTTRFDFGLDENGAIPTGGAIVAAIELPNGSVRRHLLLPTSPELGYGGHLSAPAFEPLADALRIEVPRGATASAFVGRIENWTRIEIDLSEVKGSARLWLEFHAVTSRAAPAWWAIDDLRVGEPGPAHDVGIVGLPTIPSGTGIGRGVATPLALTIADLGRYAPREARIEAWVVDPAGNISYGPHNLTLIDLKSDETQVVLPLPWTPVVYGRHVVHARVLSTPSDERSLNDRVLREVEVRDELGATLLADTRGLVGAARPAPGAPLALEARVRNNGTLPLGGPTVARLSLQVYDGPIPLLATPLEVDLAAFLGRPIRPGETADVRLPNAWTPPRSGVFRAQIGLHVPQIGDDRLSVVERTLRIEETLTSPILSSFAPDGRGWTNASASAEAATWTFLAKDAAAANLTSPEPFNLRGAASATLALTHRHRLEQGFDGAVVEARTPRSDWFTLTPVGGYPSAVLAPSSLVPSDELTRAAFTGVAGTTTTLFDLSSHPALRERVTILDVQAADDSSFDEKWLGPSGEGYYAASRPTPMDPPQEAIAYERTDTLRFRIDVPADAHGEMLVQLRDWRGLGLHGVTDVLPSRVRVTIEGPDGVRHDAARAENDDDRYADWSLHTLRFPTTLPTLAGRNATIVIEHTEVAARVPASLQTDRAEQTTFASDIVSPHYGYAVADVNVVIESGIGRAELSLGEPASTATARWLFEDETSDATQETGGFVPLATGSVWTQDAEGWIARAEGAQIPDARLIMPVDLRLATTYARLVLNETHRLTRLNDTLANVSGGISLAGLDVSTDGGRTWRPAPTQRATKVFTLPQDDQYARHSTFGSDPDAQRNSRFGVGGVAVSGDSPDPTALVFDLSEYAGNEVLIALHASFSTTPAARADEWRIRSLRIEADIFRGDLVDLRLRAASDADGMPGAWEIVNLTTSVIRHGTGIGVRILQPDDAPHTAGFRTIVTEVVNRGSDTTPPTVLSLLVTDPPERGGRGHGANRTVPSLAPGASAVITVRGADVNWFLAANATASNIVAIVAQIPGESFTADNAADRVVGGPNVQERSLVVPVALNVTPQALVFEPGKRPVVTFAAWVKNDGEDPATLGPSTVRLWKGETNVRNLTNAIPSGARILPGEGREVVWSWKPDASLPRGSYRAEVEIATTTARGLVLRSLNTTLLVGDAYFGEHAGLERFGNGIDAWTCVTQAPCAREETTIFRSAPTSLAVGVPPTSLSTSNSRTIIDSPEYPLNATLGAIVRLHARHSLGTGESARVLLAEVFVNGSVSTFREAGRVAGRSTGYDELRFAELAYRFNTSPEARGVLVRFDAPTPSNTSAPSFIIDDLSVAPLDASWSAAGRVFVADGVAKTIRVFARNDGMLADTYVVTMRDADDDPVALPAGWSLEIVDAATRRIVASSVSNATSRISIPPGGLRALDMLVTTPQTGAGAPFRGRVPMALTLNSTTLPDLSRTLDLDLRSQGAARSDVGILGAEVRGASEPPGRLRTIEIALVNRGLAPAVAPLRVLVHPPDDVEETPENVADLQGVATPIVTLGPGARKTITFLWTPRHAGEHRIVIALDPNNALDEANRSDHERELDVRVAALPFPDLRVALSLDEDASYLGRPIIAIVNVTNVGAATARDIGLSLRAGVVDLLPEGSPAGVGDLAPSETRRVRAEWSPEVPGNVTLIATAFARAGLSERVETLDDNVRTHVAFVREPSARLERGDEQGTFRLVNGGNAEETYLLGAVLPARWSYAIRIDGQRGTRAELVPNGSAALTIEPFPPPGTLAGEYEIVIEATSAQTGETRRSAARHVIAPEHALRVALLPPRIDPREPYLELLIENDGNTAENVTFAANRLPEGWRLTGTQASVTAGARTTARLVIDMGKEDGPRVTPIELHWNAGPLQGELVGSASVATIHDISLTLEGDVVAGRSANATLRISNDGNVAESGVLRIELPPGFATDLGERAVHVAKGRSVELVGWLAAPEDAPPKARAELAFEGEITANGRARFDVSRHDLTLTWNPTAAGRAGEPRREILTTTNVGTAAALESTVTLYVDGEAIATTSLGTIEPGTEADATLSWTPAEGSHTIAILVQTLDGSSDATPADNGRALTLHFPTPESLFAAAATRAETPTLPLGVLLVSIAILAVWVGRRRL